MCCWVFRQTCRFILIGLALMSFLAAAGCTGKRASVAGAVTYDGQPVDGGRIFFIPQGDPVGRPAVHATIEQGKYYLPAAQGPELGKHRVEIVWHKPPPGKEHLKQGDPGFTTDNYVQVLPAAYNAKTTLFVDLQQGDNMHDFALKKHP